MKHLILSILLSIFLASTAMADWIEDFDISFATQGIEIAVEKALGEGKTPAEIINHSIEIEGLNPQNVLKALYCEGVAGDDIKNAAYVAGISELILLAAFDKSVAECGDAVADSQAYTPVGPSFSGFPSPNDDEDRDASPATFN